MIQDLMAEGEDCNDDLLLDPEILIEVGAEAEIPSSSSSDYEDFETASLVQSFRNDHNYILDLTPDTSNQPDEGRKIGEALGLRGHLGQAHHVHGSRHNSFRGNGPHHHTGCPFDESFPQMEPLRLHLPQLHHQAHHHHHFAHPHFRQIHQRHRDQGLNDLKRLPDTLGNYALSSIAANFLQLTRSLHILPPSLQFAVFRKLYLQGRLCQIGYEFCDFRLFSTILGVTHKRWELHQMFQAVMDHGLNLADILVSAFAHLTHPLFVKEGGTLDQIRSSYRRGYQLAVFLLDGGWFLYAEQCLQSCQRIAQLLYSKSTPMEADLRSLECSYRLLEAYNGYCLYYRAFSTMEQCKVLLRRVEEQWVEGELQLNPAEIYNQFSILYFDVSKYNEALDFSKRSLALIRRDTPPKTVIEVFRQAAKVLTVRRHFAQADLLIRHAVSVAKCHFDGAKRFPDVLLDFGFYLTNVDMSEAASKMHQMALDYRLEQFGGMNIRVAQAHEDLAYALYVQEYSSGNFARAKDHSEKALIILREIVPDNHLLLSSCRRVKALILEEIAIDSQDKMVETQLLHEAEDLHISALNLCKRMFGEENIATAKHYGNLGRLYQSMQKLDEAEKMHQRAIAIKKRLMGEEDYEVALSIGHLASLYNYDMRRFKEAEELYLKSMHIGKRLLGDAYSGLEYDYRGLVHCYMEMREMEKVDAYTTKLHNWKLLRDAEVAKQTPESLWQSLSEPRNTLEVIEEFFKKFSQTMPTVQSV